MTVDGASRQLAGLWPQFGLPLAVFLAGEPVGGQDLWAEDFAARRSVASGSWITRHQHHGGQEPAQHPAEESA